ncbi:hypothetical protein DNTS_034564 [Danionella cerebrum]|uniref:dolichyl-phosphate-mannose--protein mannosyltransferase n=1 Tax=Danionella cerebrum TaxID=2873325 RepID=A0A553R1D1_9TELE|nr:hypothetical protein DNTS_034564 [Danionella translucida]
MNILYDDFWGTLLTHSGSHKSFRPLCTLSFRLNYAMGGLDPWGYHLFNLVLHCCVTAVFTGFCRPLLGGGSWSLLAGLLFASHPIHTEAVAGVAGLWLGGSLAAATAALLWKEQGVTVLAVSALYDIFIVHRLHLWQTARMLWKWRNKGLLVSLACLTCWGVILLAARFYWMGNKPPNFSNADNPAADSPHFLSRVLTFLYLPSVNVWLLLCPDKLSFDWSMDAIPLVRSIDDWRNLQSVMFYAGFALVAWFGLSNSQKNSTKINEANGKSHTSNGKSAANGCNHNQNGYPKDSPKSNGYHKPQNTLPATGNVVVFSLGLLVFPFIPATNLFFYVGFVVAERVLYIPSMGFCLLATVALRSLFIRCRSKCSKAFILTCTTGVVLLYSLKTVRRNQDWQSEEMLYRSGIAVNPAKAWGNLGNVLKNQGKLAEAEKAYRSALYYRSNMADMLYNLGLLLQESERFSEALDYYKMAIGSRPTLASAYLNVGIVLVSQGKNEEAKRAFHTCADIPDENLKDPHAHKSSVTSCLYNLGKLLHEEGQHEVLNEVLVA